MVWLSMTLTLSVPDTQDNAGALLSRRWTSGGHRCPIATRIAARLGLRPMAVEKLLWGPDNVFDRATVAVEEFVGSHARARIEKPMRRLLAAYGERTTPPLCGATFNLAQEADAAEDVAETAYLSDPSDVNLDRLIAKSEREIQREESRLLALHAERIRRRMAR